MLCNCHMESGLTYLLKSIAFCEGATIDYTIHFALNLAFLQMIQEIWPGNFSHLTPNLTQEELAFPLSLSTNADFCKQNPNTSYPMNLLQEPTSLTALCSSLKTRSLAPQNRNSPFPLSPRQEYPVRHLRKGSLLFHLALHIFYFSSGVIVFLSIGPKYMDG